MVTPAAVTFISVSPEFVMVSVIVELCPTWTDPNASGSELHWAGPCAAEDTATGATTTSPRTRRTGVSRLRIGSADEDVPAACAARAARATGALSAQGE